MHRVFSATLVAFALLGTAGSATAQNPPFIDVGFCIDVSSSVDATELGLEVTGLKSCLAQLPTNGDVAVAVAVYAAGAAAVTPLTTLTPASLAVINNDLDGLLSNRIVSTSSTDIEAGLNVSIAQLALGDGPTQAIILVGDGVLTMLKGQKADEHYDVSTVESHFMNALLVDNRCVVCKEDMEKFGISEDQIPDASAMGADIEPEVMTWAEIQKELDKADHLLFT